MADNMVQPQTQAGPGLPAQIAQATSTGKPIDFGGYTYALTASAGTWGSDQYYQARGAKFTWAIDAAMAVLSQGTDIDGVSVTGSGNPAHAANVAFRLPDDKGQVSIDMRASNMGRAGFANENNANRNPSRLTGSFWNNQTAVDHLERGEYCLFYGFAIGGTPVTPGTSTKVGVRMKGGNNPLVAGIITDQGTGLEILYGPNDAHTVATGVTINHCDLLVKAGPISTKDFGFIGGALYAGRIEISGSGYRFVGNGCGSWGIAEKAGADNSVFAWNTFRHMPDDPAYVAAYGGYQPNVGGPTCVHYVNNVYPASVLGNSPWRQTTAVSKRTVSTQESIPSGTPAVVNFATNLVNALQANLAFSKYELWSTTNKCWSMLSFASPISSGRAEASVQITLGTIWPFDDAAIDVYLSLRDNSNVEQERHYFSRSSERISGGDVKRVFSFNGSVEKHYRTCVMVDNRSGGNVTLYAHNGPEFPSIGRVCGW